MRLYHVTTREAGEAILRAGFKDTTGYYGFCTLEGEPLPFTGVWFADRPLGVDEGAASYPFLGAPVLVIELDEAAIEDYEIQEEDKPYREWCIPAVLANQHLLGVIYEPKDERMNDQWWEDLEPIRPVHPA